MDSDSDSTVGDIYEVERILDAKKKVSKVVFAKFCLPFCMAVYMRESC